MISFLTQANTYDHKPKHTCKQMYIADISIWYIQYTIHYTYEGFCMCVSIVICDACEEMWTLPVVPVPSVYQ